MIASFHLVHYRRRSIASGLARLELDSRSLRRVGGLGFRRLLITTPGPPERPLGRPIGHPARSALFAVWEDEAALDAFLEGSAVAARWRAHAKEVWHVRLEPLHSRGTCLGQDPFSGIRTRGVRAEPAAMFTYITLRTRGHPPFWRIFPHVASQLARHPGFLAGALGSEPPPHTYYRNFTFSVWSSLDQAMRFAYHQPGSPHAEAADRSLREGWQREFLFARFRAYASAGTWNGRNPLAGVAEVRATGGAR
jgi:heme-degrading monooxygenase HmoA